ncbi:AI-2E family transporter [Carnobacterium funditum]|uniref:AI-2E family transporter n=1 Tax=Carnobacterium funditum TaxID=2752 RepID=UPI000554A0AF|nr:AI-2E family transporter [Carnobacterium funditum]
MNLFKSSKLLFWTLWSLAAVLTIYISTKISFVFQPLYALFSTLFVPVLIAGFLYYLMNPFIKLIEKVKVKRSYGIIIVMILAISGTISFGIKIVPILLEQLSELIINIPNIIANIEIQADDIKRIPGLEQVDFEEVLTRLNLSLDTISNTVLSSITTSISSIISTITGLAVVLITVPIILFYLFHDGQKFTPAVAGLFPTKYKKHVIELLSQMNVVVSGYVSGKGLASIIVGILVYIGMLFIGLPYSLLLAIICGATNMIPYIGPFIGAAPAFIIGLTISPGKAILVVLLIVIIQQVDINFLTPKFVGKNLDIHPLTIIVVLLVAGKMAGIVGIIFGVPGFAVIKTIVVYIKNLVVEENKKVKLL